MISVGAALIALGGDVLPNATWDGIKSLYGLVRRQGLSAEALFAAAFTDSLEAVAGEVRDEDLSGEMGAILTDQVAHEGLLDRALQRVGIDEFTSLALNLYEEEFGRRLTEALLAESHGLSESGAADASLRILTRSIVDGAVAGFQDRLLGALTQDQATVLLLKQAIKIDLVLEHLTATAKSRGVSPHADSGMILAAEVRAYLDGLGMMLTPAAAPALYVAEDRSVLRYRTIVGCADRPADVEALAGELADRARDEHASGVLIVVAHGNAPALPARSAVPVVAVSADTIRFTDPRLDDYGAELLRRIELTAGTDPSIDVTLEDDAGHATVKIEQLLDPRERLVVISGDFGTGKSWLLRRLACHAAASSSGNAGRLPVLLSLSELGRWRGLRHALQNELSRHGLDVPPSVIRNRLDNGGFVVLADGLDELDLFAEEQPFAEMLAELQGAAQAGNVVVASVRTHFFRDAEQEREICDDAALFRTRNWSYDEVRSYFTLAPLHSAPQALTDPRLLELSRVPAFAVRLLRLARREGAALRTTDVFTAVVREWFDAEGRRGHSDPRFKARIVQALALTLMTSRIKAVHHADLRSVLVRWAAPGAVTELDYLERDTRTSAFLVRELDGRYRFSHRGFLSYFVAANVADFVKSKHDDSDTVRGLLRAQKLGPDSWEFAADLIGDIEALRPHIENALDHGQGFETANLMAVWLAAGQDARDFDLRGRFLRDVELRGRDLSGVSLAGSNLFSANLNDCCLERVDLRGADLHRAAVRPSRGAYDIAMAADGRVLVAPVGSDAVWVSNALDGEPTQSDVVHRDEIWTIAVSADQRSVATGGRDNQVLLWRGDNLALEQEFAGHDDNVWDVAFSASGDVVASVSSDATVRTWRRGCYSPEVVKAVDDELRSVAFLSESTLLVAGVSGFVGIVDTSGSELSSTIISSPVLTATARPGGGFAAGTLDGRVVWLNERLKEIGSVALESPVRSLVAMKAGQAIFSTSDGRLGVALLTGESATLIKRRRSRGVVTVGGIPL